MATAEAEAPEGDDRYLLAPYGGARVPGPAWFEAAIAAPRETGRIAVAGAGIDYRCWGARGRQGVLLVHGSNAHAGWWDHIGPLLGADFRVAALSLSGMGGSDWRARYSDALHAEEMRAVAEAAGLFEGGTPFIVAHSFGGLGLAALATGADAARLAGAVFLDSGVMLGRGGKGERPPAFPRRFYPSEREALARFRPMPSQPGCEPWIADHIGRGSLVRSAEGWTWAFDPDLWTKVRLDAATAPPPPACRVAFVWGEESAILTPERVGHQRDWAPPGTPFVAIPGSGHHLMLDQPLALVAALRALLAAWGPAHG